MTGREMTITLPTDALAVAAMQREAEADAPAYAELAVLDANDYTIADEILTDLVRRKDAAIAMRKEATGPMYTAARVIESWFKPLVSTLESCETHVKRAMGGYRLAQEARERYARELAARAAETNAPAEDLITALTRAADAGTAPAGRATVRMVWRVKVVDFERLPREYTMPNMKAIEAFAREHAGEDAPELAGVTFERGTIMGARR
jgi:hypothetical protein